MQIQGRASNLNITFAELDAQLYTMIAFDVEARSGTFGGQIKGAWISAEDFKTFAHELEAFEQTRQGEVSLTALGNGSDHCPFHLRLFPLDRLGHIAASVEIIQSNYIGNGRTLVADRVNVTFEAEPSSLLRILLESQRLINSLGP